MRNRLIIIICFLGCLSVIAKAHVWGVVTDITNEPLVGVNLYWANTTQGVSTDVDGKFKLEPNSTTNLLVVSYVSYLNDTIEITTHEPITIVLKSDLRLEELDVAARKVATAKSRTAVFETQTITAEELCKAACCNLSESFETNASVDVAYSDAATGAKQIRLLGLSGQYVQMLTENIPNLRGIASPYGLGYIPGPWMDAIQVSKGTSSVINGYEALTGQINVEYKKPQSSEPIAVSAFFSDAARVELNANAAFQINPYLSTGLLVHASDEFAEFDHNHDHFADMPAVSQYNFINRWYYKRGGYVGQAFVRAMYENRHGGQLTIVPDRYEIDIKTKRGEMFLKNGYVFDAQKETSVGIILNGVYHQQDAIYGEKNYTGLQGTGYLNAIFQTSFGKNHKLSTGLSFNYDFYRENYTDYRFLNVNDTKTPSYYKRTRNEIVPGAFAEYTFNLDDKLIILGGVRADYHNMYGVFATPRLNVKYAPWEFLHFRGSVGKGYRAPNVLAENNNLLASSRYLEIASDLKMENAWNYGSTITGYIPVGKRELTLTAEWYYTNFINQTVVDVDTDPHKVFFYNLQGKSHASSAQIEANMEIFNGFTATLAYRLTDVKTTINGTLREKPLTNRYKGLATVSYQTPLKKWQFDFTTQFNGGGRLPDTYQVTDAIGTSSDAWEKTFKPYVLMNAQVTKYFKTWSVYVGSENLTNFVQSNLIVDAANPFGKNFDATMVWGPAHGRKIYLGLRWALDKN